MRNLLLGVVAAISCPCHLPVILTLLGGAAVGGTLAAYRFWIVLAMSLVFTGAMLGLVLGRREATVGSEPAPGTGDEVSGEWERCRCTAVPQAPGVPSTPQEVGYHG